MPYYQCPACGVTVHSAAAFSALRTCQECSAALPADARVYPTPIRHIRRVLAARPDAAGKARHAARALPLSPATRDKLELIASELVANAVLHAGLEADDPISVHITSRSDRVRISVRDPGPGFELPSNGAAADPLAADGRGFVIVAALTDAWGIDCDRSGCTVWCEVEVDERPREAVDRQITDAYLNVLAGQMTASPAASPR